MRAVAVDIAVVVRVCRFGRPHTLAMLVVRMWLCEELRWRRRRARATSVEDHKLRISVQIHGRELERVQPTRLACNASAVLIALTRADDEKLTNIYSEVLLSAAPAILVPE
jgi:hypothetical protein